MAKKLLVFGVTLIMYIGLFAGCETGEEIKFHVGKRGYLPEKNQ